MSSALTFYFKNIFPNYQNFEEFLTEYNVVDTSTIENSTFAEYIYKILYRRYHNSNIQYDTIEDFKCDFANVIEDTFSKYQKQVDIIQKMQNLTDKELLTISTAIANTSTNPNTKLADPESPIEYVSAQAYTIAKDNKLQAYLRALESIPTKLIGIMLQRCVNLFKSIIPNQVFVYDNIPRETN